jgi:DNA-binding response OmpR family regulator
MSVPYILFVEDHRDTAVMVKMFLESMGYSVVAVATASEALSRAQDMRFDLYLLDLGLPDMDGIELCRQIRAFDSTTPILFSSGYSDRRAEALLAGAQDFVAKPADLDELETKIAHWVQASRRTREEQPT